MTKLNQEQHEQIKAVFKKTGSIKATAKQTGFSRNAVRRHLRGFSKVPNYKKRASKLDPYKAKINHLVKEKLLSAVRVLEEIRELGYEGGYSILKNYIRLIRPKPLKRPTPPIFHPPGHESQMDWSPHNVIIGGREQIVHTGSIVVCFSRWLFFRHFLDETIESVIALHKEAFSELGYVTEIITYDNMTTVGRHIGPGKVWINPRFKRFADEYGFTVVILPPGKKERHGKVERPFHYIENNFLAGREFKDMEDLNHRADKWRSHTANVRIHGTLRERPVDRLKREIPYLKPLPQLLSASFYKEVDRLLHSDFCVSINTNRYSANPERIGQYTKVRLYNDHLEIWIDDKFDCRHSYAVEKQMPNFYDNLLENKKEDQ
jgi:transposase